MKRIVLTGGGTAGHVTPNLALIPHLAAAGWDIVYIGSVGGMERGLVEPTGVPFYEVATGKLRRYRDLKNLSDPFRVLKGTAQAAALMGKLRPNVVFSKGGFVSVPVVYGAALHGVPVVLHESDLTPGLANKLCAPFAKAVCTTFPETAKAVRHGVYTGTPLRDELFAGQRKSGLAAFSLSGEKPVLMVTGGSSGAQAINAAVRAALPKLLPDFDVLHLCGKGKIDPTLVHLEGYAQYEYIKEELKDLFALTDIVVSRAGANAICELLALHKPNLLIPLPANASRGDQLLNARSFERQGFSVVLEESEMTDETLLSAINRLYENREVYTETMKQSSQQNSIDTIIDLIESVAR